MMRPDMLQFVISVAVIYVFAMAGILGLFNNGKDSEPPSCPCDHAGSDRTCGDLERQPSDTGRRG